MTQSTEPLIVTVLQLTRLKEFKGNQLLHESLFDNIYSHILFLIQISNSWTATKILFNPNIPEVDEFTLM